MQDGRQQVDVPMSACPAARASSLEVTWTVTKVVDESGKVFQAAHGSFAGRPDYPVANLAAGQNTDGRVVFDVSKGAAESGRIQLKVQQLFADSAYGYWTL